MSNPEQQNQAEDNSIAFPFRGIKKHSIGYFETNFLDRHEEHKSTLKLFETLPEFGDNTYILNRPHAVFHSSSDTFESLKQEANKNEDFVQVEIIEKNSDLGLFCYFYAKHKSGEEIFFDGVIFRISLKITDKPFHLKDISSLIGYPSYPKSIRALGQAIEAAKDGFSELPSTCRNFYSAIHTDWEVLGMNWEILGIKDHENTSMQLIVHDPNIITVVGTDQIKYGEEYKFYIGKHQNIVQLISHDLYQCKEIQNWRSYILSRTDQARNSFQAASNSFSALSKSFWHLRLKIKTWSNAKEKFNYILQELQSLYRYQLLVETYEKVASYRLSCINKRSQVSFLEHEGHNYAAIADWQQYFFVCIILDNQIKVSKNPIQPAYTNHIEFLKNDVQNLNQTVKEAFNISKDLFATAQTEFSAYSIWLAILAIMISAFLGAIPLVQSSRLSESQTSAAQLELNSSSQALPAVSSGLDATILLFDTNKYTVRIFTQDDQILMNLYNKENKNIQLNAIPLDVKKTRRGTRYINSRNMVVVEISDFPTLLLDGKVEQ